MAFSVAEKTRILASMVELRLKRNSLEILESVTEFTGSKHFLGITVTETL